MYQFHSYFLLFIIRESFKTWPLVAEKVSLTVYTVQSHDLLLLIIINCST